jgi:hypothetical protein
MKSPIFVVVTTSTHSHRVTAERSDPSQES